MNYEILQIIFILCSAGFAAGGAWAILRRSVRDMKKTVDALCIEKDKGLREIANILKAVSTLQSKVFRISGCLNNNAESDRGLQDRVKDIEKELEDINRRIEYIINNLENGLEALTKAEDLVSNLTINDTEHRTIIERSKDDIQNQETRLRDIEGRVSKLEGNIAS